MICAPLFRGEIEAWRAFESVSRQRACPYSFEHRNAALSLRSSLPLPFASAPSSLLNPLNAIFWLWMNARLCPAAIKGTISFTTVSRFRTPVRTCSLLAFASRSRRFSTFLRPQGFLHSPLDTTSKLQTVPLVTRLQSRSLSSTQSIMATNGEARPKRRTSPTHPLERPSKHLKAETAPTPGDATPQNGTVYSTEMEVTQPPILNTMAAAADSPEWQATIENVIKSAVSIHFCQTCSFDTDLSMSSQATGFVVDSERGYIMTNRHVVCSGPFWGYCLFENHEEVCVTRMD